MADLTPEAQAQLAELATTLAHNPKTRRQFVSLVREVDPTKRFLDVEAEELKETVTAEFAKRDAAAEKAKIEAAQEAARHALTSRYSEDDIKKIEEGMTKHGIADYEVGAKLYAADAVMANPRPEPRSQTWEMPKMTAADVQNPSKYALNNAYAVIDEFRGRKPH